MELYGNRLNLDTVFKEEILIFVNIVLLVYLKINKLGKHTSF